MSDLNRMAKSLGDELAALQIVCRQVADMQEALETERGRLRDKRFAVMSASLSLHRGLATELGVFPDIDPKGIDEKVDELIERWIEERRDEALSASKFDT